MCQKMKFLCSGNFSIRFFETISSIIRLNSRFCYPYCWLPIEKVPANQTYGQEHCPQTTTTTLGDNKWRTIYDCIGTLALMPKEPIKWRNFHDLLEEWFQSHIKYPICCRCVWYKLHLQSDTSSKESVMSTYRYTHPLTLPPGLCSSPYPHSLSDPCLKIIMVRK